MKVVYYPKAENFILKDCPKRIAERILTKMIWFSEQDNPLVFAKPLNNMLPATHRFRIGDYRVTFSIDSDLDQITVYKIDIRGKVYK